MALLAYLKLAGETQSDMKTTIETLPADFNEMIEVYAMDHTIEIPTDQNTGLPTGAVLHRPFTITKAKDETSPLLMSSVCTGEVMSTWELSLLQINTKGEKEEFYKITLEGAVCVAVKQYKYNQLDEAYSGYRDMEDITFTYGKIIENHVIGGVEAEASYK